MGLFRSMEISASALTAQRFRMDVIGQNIANEDTTRTESGDPYRRRVVVFAEKKDGYTFSDILNSVQENYGGAAARPLSSSSGGAGVRAVRVAEDQSDFKLVYDPEHPDADADGYVKYPNVDREKELVDMLSAVRSYEANITAINNFKNIAMKALEIGR